MKAKRTWSTPSLSIYGKVEAVTAIEPVGPPQPKCPGSYDVGRGYCGPALS